MPFSESPVIDSTKPDEIAVSNRLVKIDGNQVTKMLVAIPVILIDGKNITPITAIIMRP
ncbi:MAG: hypothetical protein WCW13_02185 [archaeon]|jgi:hypothetical protein